MEFYTLIYEKLFGGWKPKKYYNYKLKFPTP